MEWFTAATFLTGFRSQSHSFLSWLSLLLLGWAEFSILTVSAWVILTYAFQRWRNGGQQLQVTPTADRFEVITARDLWGKKEPKWPK